MSQNLICVLRGLLLADRLILYNIELQRLSDGGGFREWRVYQLLSSLITPSYGLYQLADPEKAALPLFNHSFI